MLSYGFAVRLGIIELKNGPRGKIKLGHLHGASGKTWAGWRSSPWLSRQNRQTWTDAYRWNGR
jgi:hypothetical protein